MIKQLLAKAVLAIVLIFGASLSFAQTTFVIQVGPGGTNTYSPANVTCTVGDTISFVWVSGFHPTQTTNTTTIPLVDMDGTGGIHNVYKTKMLTAGVFPYECTVHGGMGGIITVNPTPTSYASFTGTGSLNSNGWSTHSGTAGQVQLLTTVSDAGNSLSYPGFAASSDNRVQIIAGNGEDLNKQIPIISNSGAAYYSVLLKLPNVTGQALNSSVGNYFMHLNDSAGLTGITNFAGRLTIRAGSVANTFNLGIVNTSGGTAPTAVQIFGATPTDYAINQTYLVVVKYVFATNTASLWVNPAITPTEPSPIMSNAVGTSPALSKVKSVCIRQAGTVSAGTGNIEIDEIRVGSSWTSVVQAGVVNPSVKFNPTTLSVNENVGTATVTLNVTNPNSTATSVDVNIKGGTASAGSDYTFTTQTVTFPASSTTAQSFTIPIVDDVAQESDETIILALRNTTNSATIEADSLLTITIPANDVVNPVVNFVAPFTATTAEGAVHAYSVSITNPNANATGVQVFVKSTSTASGTDYTGITGTGVSLTFPASSSANQGDNVNIVDDATAENAETIVLVLRSATNSATIGNDSIITITIPTNDQPLVAHFVNTSANVNENAGTATVNVMTMGATTNGSTSFDVVVKGGTAAFGTDHTYTTQTITIPGGKDSTVAVTVPLLNDNVFEVNETIVFAIRNITNSGVISTDSVYTLTIVNDDIQFKNISDLRVNDVNGVSVLKDTNVYIRGVVYGVDMQGSATSLQYTLIDPTGGVGIFRSGASNPPIISLVPEEGDSVRVYGKVGEFNGLTQVNMDSIVLISKGNPLRDPKVVTQLNESTESDLVIFKNAQIVDTLANSASGTTLRISNGTDSLDLRIDADVSLFGQPIEGKFDVIGLGGQFDNSNPKNSGYQLLPRSINDVISIIVIVPTVNIDSALYNTTEGSGTKSVKVSLSSATTETTSVTFALTGGSAIFNSDFTFGNPGTLTFAPGVTEATVTFTITDDATIENNETINFAISDPSKCMLGTVTSSSIIIKDNDFQGVNGSKAVIFNVYPNPTNQKVNVIANESIQTITIVNMLGQSVLTINAVNSLNKTIDVSELSAGVYNVVVSTENGSSSKRLIVK